MPSAYQKSRPAAPAQPTAGEAFIPGLTPGVFSLESDKEVVGLGDQFTGLHQARVRVRKPATLTPSS
jgi:hypothetical protein